MMRSLVEDLHAQRERIKLGGGETKVARQHATEKLTARERLALLIDDGSWVELGIQAQPHFSQSAMAGRRGSGRRSDHRLRQGRRSSGRRRRLRLHGDGRRDGHDRRAQGHAPAGAGADQADPVDLAARLGRRTHPGGGWITVRRNRPAVSRPGRDERCRAAGRGRDGTVRRRYGVYPRAGRLRADGEGARIDGAGRTASGARRRR